MFQVDSFVLRNVVHFNEVKVPVKNNNGFVVITGLNKDSKIAEDQSNGAGKSLLWSAFPNAIYSASPSSTLKNSKKDMLDSSKSEIDIRGHNSLGKKVRIVQTPSKWKIYEENEDGKLQDVESHRQAHQVAKIAEHFPLSIDEFYAYTYLSSIQGQRLHFQVERPAERLKFLTSVFQLDSYDKLKKYFTQMLGKIADEQTKFNVLESKLLSANTQLKRVAWTDESAAEKKALKKKFEQIKDERDSVYKEVVAADTQRKALRNLAKHVEIQSRLASDLPNKPIKELRSSLQKKRKALELYAQYVRDKEAYERAVSRHTEKLEQLDVSTPLSELKAEGKKLEKRLAKVEAARDAAHEEKRKADRATKKYEQLTARLEALGFEEQSVPTENVDDELSVCRTTLQLKKLLDAEHSSCPTCQQDVDIKTVAKSVKIAAKRIKELEKIQSAQELVEDIREIEPHVKQVDVTKHDKRYKEVKKRIQELTEKVEDARLAKHIEQELESLEAPEPVTAPKGSIAKVEKRLDTLDKLVAVNDVVKNICEEHGLTTEQPEEQLEREEKRTAKLNKKLATLHSEYKEVTTSLSKLDLRQGEYRVLIKQKLTLEQELEQIKPLLDKRDLYKALEKAYSAKGIKVNKANEITGLLQNNMNRYANLIFAEPFKFYVFVNDKGVFCEVDRSNGKRTDVRVLSGAESECFRLLFMLSLMIMVPPERRTNFVVLDEPDSHMDVRTKTLFVERYLPFLRELVPHVFLITPNDHHLYHDAEQWIVVKEDGVSTLHTTRYETKV